MQVTRVELFANGLKLGAKSKTSPISKHIARRLRRHRNRTLHPDQYPPFRYEGSPWQP